MKNLIPIVLILITVSCFSQDTVKANLKGLENLIGGSWVTKGKWASGNDYHQEISFEWSLSKTLITAKTYDYIDAKQFEDSLRNFGIRSWDEKRGEIVFHDWNVFGGMVSGTVSVEGKNIYYHYLYDIEGHAEMITDAWIYRDDHTYDFKVGIYRNGVWERTFVTSVFERR